MRDTSIGARKKKSNRWVDLASESAINNRDRLRLRYFF